MVNPEKGKTDNVSSGVGDWGIVTIEAPQFLQTVLGTIDNVAELLLAVLNIFAAILNAAKAFTLSFLDPLTGLIEGFLELLESTIKGIQNIGVYIHGDWYLLKDAPEFRQLLGGYTAYERRMINRLIDPRDPGRPNFDKGTISVAFFMYINSGDASSLMRSIQFLMGFLKLFGAASKSRVRSLGTVTDVKVKYGFEGSQGIINKPLFEALIDRNREKGNKGLKQAGQPNIATLEWKLAAAPGNFFSPVASLAPAGFYIEVSIDPQPFLIMYDIVAKGKQVPDCEEPNNLAPNRVRGLVVDEAGNTIQISGGSRQFKIQGNEPSEIAFFAGGCNDPRCYLVKSTSSTETIPIGGLWDSGNEKFYLQRTFFASNIEVGGLAAGSVMTFSIKLSDMPLKATFDDKGKVIETSVEPADTFYVRIRPVSDSASDVEKDRDDNDNDALALRYRVNFNDFNAQVVPIRFIIDPTNFANPDNTFSYLDRGESSAPVKITYPNANTADYLECVLASLILMALVRPDLLQALDEDGEIIEPDGENWGELQNKVRTLTGLEDIAGTLLPQITGRANAEPFYKGEYETSIRNKIYNRCSALTERLYRANNPPPSIQKLVVERCQPLITATFKQFNIADDSDSKIVSKVESARNQDTKPDVKKADLSEFTLIDAMLSNDDEFGVGMNPKSLGEIGDNAAVISRNLVRDIADGLIPPYWDDQFYFRTEFQPGATAPFRGEGVNVDDIDPIILYNSSQVLAEGSNVKVTGSVTNAPVFYIRRGLRVTKILYCRNELSDFFDEAVFALNVASGPTLKGANPDGKWITTRVGLIFPAMDGFLEDILAWFRALISAGDSIGKAIRQYIDFAQARIIELQTFIRRINAALQNLFDLFFVFPSAAVLVVISQGSEGIMEGLVTAGNKPGDGPNSYSAGAVLVGAGPALPKILIDLFKPE